MDSRFARLTRQVTSVSLAAAAVLIGPGVAGLTPSLPLAAASLLLAVALLAARDTLPDVADNEFVRVHAPTLWIGPALAAAVAVLYVDLTPGELQTAGALIGLAGMVNYLLRPVYILAGSLLRRLSGFASGS